MPKHLHRKCLDLNCPVRVKKLKYSLEHLRYSKFVNGIHKNCKNFDVCDCFKCTNIIQEIMSNHSIQETKLRWRENLSMVGTNDDMTAREQEFKGYVNYNHLIPIRCHNFIV